MEKLGPEGWKDWNSEKEQHEFVKFLCQNQKSLKICALNFFFNMVNSYAPEWNILISTDTHTDAEYTQNQLSAVDR